MLTGLPPFYDENVNEMYRKILQDPLRFPEEVGSDARSLLTGLLTRDPSQRLGVNGAEEIKRHPFFAKAIDWKKLMQKKIQPPFKPSVVRFVSPPPPPLFLSKYIYLKLMVDFAWGVGFGRGHFKFRFRVYGGTGARLCRRGLAPFPDCSAAVSGFQLCGKRDDGWRERAVGKRVGGQSRSCHTCLGALRGVLFSLLSFFFSFWPFLFLFQFVPPSFPAIQKSMKLGLQYHHDVPHRLASVSVESVPYLG
jgi:hypothetical protein